MPLTQLRARATCLVQPKSDSPNVIWTYQGSIRLWSEADSLDITLDFNVQRCESSTTIAVTCNENHVLAHTSYCDWWQVDAQHNAKTLLLLWICCSVCNTADDYVMVVTGQDRARAVCAQDFEDSGVASDGAIEWGPSEVSLRVDRLECINEAFLVKALRRLQA